MSCYGCESHYGYDAEGYELRVVGAVLVECPQCHAELVLEADTDGWIQRDDGRWEHVSYGPAQGVCDACMVLVVDTWDGTTAYQLEEV